MASRKAETPPAGEPVAQHGPLAAAAPPAHAAPPEKAEASPAPPPPHPKRPIACVIVHGQYIHADGIANQGDTVMVPADEIEKLAHCLRPVE
jgi:hypothetical protein